VSSAGALIGPGGGLVGPAGGLLGPGGVHPPSGVIVVSGAVPTLETVAPRSVVGPAGGVVGPSGGLVGPGPFYAVIRIPPSGVITLSGGIPGLLTPSGVITISGPNPDQVPTDASWLRTIGNPILEPTEDWEGDQITGSRIVQRGGYYHLWYSAGAGLRNIGYASCPDTLDPTNPVNWTKWPTNPLEGTLTGEPPTGEEPYRLFFIDDFGDLRVAASVDGLTNWSEPVLALERTTIRAWGARDAWQEGSLWKMLIAGASSTGRWGIYYAESSDGLTWTLGRGGSSYTSLRLATDAATAGPCVRRVDGRYQLWYQAAPAAGNLPTDIYHASSSDLTADGWTTPTLVLEHAGSGFEVDQVAEPDVFVGTGAAEGLAFLFYSGLDNGAGTGAIGAAVAFPVGGITVTIGDGDLITSDISLPFDIGAITSEITLPFDIDGPPITSDITLPFDLRGDVFSEVTLPFDILGPVTSDVTLPFDILDTAIIGGGRVRGVPDLWQPLMVFDKGGNYLGSINAGAFNVSNPPVRYLRSTKITNEGGMTFNVPRQSGDMGLIADDRLVRLQSPRGEKPWWGTMSVQPDARGIHEVTNKDPFTLLRDGRGITLKEDVNDDTPATAVMAKVMAIHNDLRAANGEVQWELDLQGSRPFRGDIDFDADTLSCIDIILKRSRTEIAWDSRLDGNRLVPILRMRDRFDAGAGATIFDGPDGNVTAGAQVVEDPTTLVFRLRLRGLTTDLAACLPEWAQWALLDITPEVTVEVDPGPYRMREIRDESVDWGLSKAAIAAQCNAILDWLWALYRSYLRAIHDIEGRPNHPGWAYVGPPDIYEPKSAGKDSLSRRAWRTRLQLVEVRDNEPASAVMISEGHSQINLREWLIVRYNRVTGVQNVTVWAIETAKGVELIKWNLSGSATLYKVSGDRIIDRSTISDTGAFVDPYNTRIYDPVARRYRELRRIINGPFALAYYIDPAAHDNSFVDLGVDAAISTTAGDGSSLISKMYDFERFAIENWDPRRDGIGARLARPTVFFGSETTRPRWHVVSFDVGGDANTALTHGISASETDIEVDSIFGFPDPDLNADEFPFLVSIDDGLDEEDVLVLSMTGTLWHIVRAQNGTTAIIHEGGAPVRRFGADAWPGFPFPYTWPEGKQWAEEELAELSKPRIDVNVHVAHFRDDQLTIDYGSTHAVDVSTEGAPGRWIGTGRIIGWSTDPGHNPTADDPTPPGGETEVILEWQQ
jgi:hypothetical protein